MSGTVTSVGLNTTTRGLIITGSPITTAGVIAINLNAELEGLADITTVGIVTRISTGVYATRTITPGISGNIIVNNGDGVNGNPIIELNSNLSLTNIYSNNFIMIGAAWNISLTAPSTMTSSYSFILPGDTGSSGQFLKTNGGSGIATTSWGTAVTSVNMTTTTPSAITIVGSTLTTTPTFSLALSTELTALSIITFGGLVTRTATGTYVGRTIIGSNNILVTNGDGIKGNPTLDISPDLVWVDTSTASINLISSNNNKLLMGVAGNVPTGGIILTLPATYGATGQVLSTSSTGITSWINRLGDPAPSASSNVITVLEEDRDTITKEALDIFNRLDFKKYEFIDKEKNGDKVVYGPIADELKEIAPKWVKSFMEFIPNIMKNTKIISGSEVDKKFLYDLEIKGITKLDNTIKESHQLKIIDDDGDKIGIIEMIKGNLISITVESELKGDIFIYGTLDECFTMEEEHIFELNMIVLQDAISQLEELKKQLKNKVN